MSTPLGDRRALLLLDLTNQTIRPKGSWGQRMDPNTDFAGLISRIRVALHASRNRGDEVVWVTPGAGFIERLSGRVPNVQETQPDLLVGEPLKNEPLVYKEEIGGFAGSTLHEILQSRGVGHITLLGVATQYVVAATAREGAELGYEVEILADGCADVDQQTHAQHLAELKSIATISRIES